MRINRERKGIDKWSNALSGWKTFQRENSKCEIKYKDVNKYNNSTYFSFSLFLASNKNVKVKIRHVLYW